MCDEGSVFCSSPYNLIHPILSYSTPYSLYPYVSCTIINQPHQASGGPPPTFSSPMTVTGPCIWAAKKKKKTKTKVKSFSPCELLCLTILDRSLIVVDPKADKYGTMTAYRMSMLSMVRYIHIYNSELMVQQMWLHLYTWDYWLPSYYVLHIVLTAQRGGRDISTLQNNTYCIKYGITKTIFSGNKLPLRQSSPFR